MGIYDKLILNSVSVATRMEPVVARRCWVFSRSSVIPNFGYVKRDLIAGATAQTGDAFAIKSKH